MEIKGENVEVDLHARTKYISHTLIGDVLPGPGEWGPTPVPIRGVRTEVHCTHGNNMRTDLIP
jgi:hypothetical protein